MSTPVKSQFTETFFILFLVILQCISLKKFPKSKAIFCCVFFLSEKLCCYVELGFYNVVSMTLTTALVI